MGWTGIPLGAKPNTKELDRLVKSWMESPTCCIIDQSAWLDFGKRKFLLMESAARGNDVPSRRFIIMLMVHYRQGEILYKDVEESMGPQEFDCPMRLMAQLESHPPLGEFSAKWREKVVAYHQDRKARNALMRDLERQYPQGDLRIILSGGAHATYGRNRHRGRTVATYYLPMGRTPYLLRHNMIDTEATKELRSTPAAR